MKNNVPPVHEILPPLSTFSPALSLPLPPSDHLHVEISILVVALDFHLVAVAEFHVAQYSGASEAVFPVGLIVVLQSAV